MELTPSRGAPGHPTTIEWKARRIRADVPWTAVVIEDGDATRRRELFVH